MTMRTLPILIVFLAFCNSLMFAAVCRENVCDRVRCATITSCNGRVIVKGGYCGCCDLCVRTLQPGESCWRLFLRGMPSDVKCPDKYDCDPEKRICVQDKLIHTS